MSNQCIQPRDSTLQEKIDQDQPIGQNEEKYYSYNVTKISVGWTFADMKVEELEACLYPSNLSRH